MGVVRIMVTFWVPNLDQNMDNSPSELKIRLLGILRRLVLRGCRAGFAQFRTHGVFLVKEFMGLGFIQSLIRV